MNRKSPNTKCWWKKMFGETLTTEISATENTTNFKRVNLSPDIPRDMDRVKNCCEKTDEHSSKVSSCVLFETLISNLECPVCLDVPKIGPIYQCRNGHLLCRECHPKLKNCPLCLIPLEKLRNLLSEKLVSMMYPDYRFSIDRSTVSHDIIWKGRLKWQERLRRYDSSDVPSSVDHSIYFTPHEVSVIVKASIKNGITEVIPIGWPTSLEMQLMPINIIRRAGKEFFSNSYSVLFELEEKENIQILKNVLDKTGLAGCVHFTGAPDCETKVLILLFSSEQQVFVGFIPWDQIKFIQSIRDEIQKENSKQNSVK